MRAVFVHDHHFVVRGHEVYSDKLPYLVWQRYLSQFQEIVVIGRAEKGSLDHQELPISSGPGVSFQFVESVSNIKALLSGGGKAAIEIESVIRDADIVIARLPSELGLLSARIARRLQKPYIAETVGCAWDALWNYGSIQGKIYAPLLFARMRLAVSAAPYVSYVSQRFLQTRYPHPRARHVVAVSNVELPATDDTVLKSRLVHIATTSEKFIIGLIGSLKTRYKGVDLAIDALARLRTVGIDAELRILGGGDPSSYSDLARTKNVGEYVHFDGLLTDRQSVMTWLDEVDVYIQPSFQEGVPRALIEAMSRGCPAIGSRCGGIPELLPTENLIPVGDATQLFKKLQHALASSEWRVQGAKQNIARAQKFDKRTLDAKRSDFLEKVALDIQSRHPRIAK